MSAQLYRDRSKLKTFAPPCLATIGNFDGVHLGHQSLLSALGAKRAELGAGSSCLISFNPHPAVVLGAASALPKITTLRQKLEIIGKHGVDALYLIRFTQEFAKLSAEQFVSKVLLEQLKVDYLVIGPDATVGQGRQGTATFIKEMFGRAGKECHIVPFHSVSRTKISSGDIRKAISAGELDKVQALLGRNYALDTIVIPGEKRGATLGFRTANLRVAEQVVPATGVYATRLTVNGRNLDSVTNVGFRPTFGSSQLLTVEAHVFELNENIYGQRVSLEFVSRLRAERKFNSVDELKAQIVEDSRQAKEILKGPPVE